MIRLFRAVTRPLKRLVRPLRLRLIDWQTRQSCAELERLYDMRDGLMQRQQIEHRHQVKLEMRRNQIVRGHV